MWSLETVLLPSQCFSCHPSQLLCRTLAGRAFLYYQICEGYPKRGSGFYDDMFVPKARTRTANLPKDDAARRPIPGCLQTGGRRDRRISQSAGTERPIAYAHRREYGRKENEPHRDQRDAHVPERGREPHTSFLDARQGDTEIRTPISKGRRTPITIGGGSPTPPSVFCPTCPIFACTLIAPLGVNMIELIGTSSLGVALTQLGLSKRRAWPKNLGMMVSAAFPTKPVSLTAH